MLTVLLIILAPLAIVVLPFEIGVAVAAFTVAVLLVREWRRALAEEALEARLRDARSPLGPLSPLGISHAGRLADPREHAPR